MLHPERGYTQHVRGLLGSGSRRVGSPLPEGSSCSWASQHGSRHPVEAGAEAQGMDASPRGGEADLESVWPGSGGPLFTTQENAQCPHWYSLTHPAPLGLDAMVQAWPRLRLSSGESAPGRGPSSFSSPILAGPSLDLGPDFPSRWLSMGDYHQEGPPLSGGRHHPPPSPGVVEVMGVAPEGAHLVASGLSTEVVETILQYRAPSTRKLYALKWRLFTSLQLFFTLDLGMFQRSPLQHHGPLYSRLFVLLPFGIRTSRRITVCVQFKHWTLVMGSSDHFTDSVL
ncbi:Proline--tRNA ligase [Labeo rohita]|uniref:Proline--tRNA ligase n=1 Tax=Labeo rohita TaxID=84645 RepID=A0ABQ8MHJ7_LABRO|nr:Proline--tRNA ligase [Labeo rohita]